MLLRLRSATIAATIARVPDVLVLAIDTATPRVALALGVDEPVVSPTFTVVREYEGTIRFVHVDVYRLDHIQELHDVGWDDLLDGDSVALVEWGERVGALLPLDRLDVRLEVAVDDDDRRVLEFVPSGASWAARATALATALGDDRVQG